MTQHSETYEQLARFINHEMRMSHVYQPVMLREVLRHAGSASVSDVARAPLLEDRPRADHEEYSRPRVDPQSRLIEIIGTTLGYKVTHLAGATFDPIHPAAPMSAYPDT